MLRTPTRSVVLFLLLCATSLAQEPTDKTTDETIRIGVANVLNQTRRSFNSTAYRAQLVQSLNALGNDRKEPIRIEAVALNATSAKSANEEAASKKCEYVLLSTARDISRLGSVRVGEGGISAMPDVALGTAVSGDRGIVVEFEGTRVGRRRTVTQGSLQPTNSPRADEQISELVQMQALRVVHDLRKDRLSQPE